MKYKYFVAFTFSCKDGRQGFGNADVGRDAPMTDMDAVAAVQDKVLADNDMMTTVALTGWQQFDKDPLKL